MPIELYPSVAKIKRNGVYENLPGFVPETGAVATQQMIATAESSATAQYVHNKGEYFRLNDTLYQAIVKISVGDAIVVGTNCEVAVLGNDVTHIANSIAEYELGIATNPHSTGEYFMVGETLYVATDDIQVGDSLSTSTNCQIAILGNDVSGLKSALSDITDTTPALNAIYAKETGTENLPTGVSHTSGYLRNMGGSNPGNLSGTSSSVNHTYWFQATETMQIYCAEEQGASRQCGVFSGSPYGASNRVSPIYASNDQNYPFPTRDTPITVEAGQYFTWSVYNSTELSSQYWTIYKITDGNTYLKDTIGLTTQMESEVDAKIDNITDNILLTGYMQIPSENWALHAWDSYSSTDNRNFRVRCKKDITFPYNVVLLASEGFYIAGYYSDGTGFDARTILNLTANKTVHLYVRRIVENGSETANVADFANALKISTKLSDLQLFKPTYSDVTMFERIGICGDSYASGGGIISGITKLTWGKCLERQTSMNVDIYGHSGVSIVEWNQSSTYGLQALLAGTECGIYWMQHGINGTSTPEALGTPDDMSASPHPATFYGQYVEAIEQIKTTFPDARIVIATIIGSSFALSETTYTDVNEAIANIAEYCEIPMIDVTKDDFYRSTWYSNWTRSNHPTAMQNAGIAMANRRLISKCIQENPEYFVSYGSNW